MSTTCGNVRREVDGLSTRMAAARPLVVCAGRPMRYVGPSSAISET